MSPIRKKVGRRIKELRKSMGHTQETLGESTGINYKYLGAIERGSGNPTLLKLWEIAKALEVDITELLTIDIYKESKEEERLRAELKKTVERVEKDKLRDVFKVLNAILSSLVFTLLWPVGQIQGEGSLLNKLLQFLSAFT